MTLCVCVGVCVCGVCVFTHSLTHSHLGVMQGHAAANLIPVIASNRIGTEYSLRTNSSVSDHITFYGSSFICDAKGELLTQANRTDECILTADFDLAALREQRASWGLFRDRRPDLYGVLLTLDGVHKK